MQETNLQVKVQLLSKRAVMPNIANIGDAGADLVATGRKFNKEHGYWEYSTDIALEIPEGYVGLIFPRSSISKYDLRLANCVGVIDSCYRGPIGFRFKETVYDRMRRRADSFFGKIFPKQDFFTGNKLYQPGDKVGQLIVMKIPTIDFKKVDELSTSNRGKNGWGSTGK